MPASPHFHFQMLNKIQQFISKFQHQPWFWVVSLFLITCLVMLPLPWLGIPIGADLSQHLLFASAYHDAILTGDFFPGWAARENYGFGSLGIRFYPPFAYYLLALSQIITNDWFTSLWTNSFFWMFVGSLGMYLWAREWLSPIESIFAAFFYAIVPYHRFQIYQLMLFAEFAAAGVLPFCFLAITRLIRRGKRIDVILFAVAIGVLILTHIPTTITGLVGLGFYALFLIDWKNYRIILVKLLISFSLSLLATSFHWLRLVSELNWVKHNTPNYAVEFYDYKQHFLPIADNLKSILPPLDSAFIIILLSLLPLFAFFFINLKTKSIEFAEKKITVALLVSGSACIFLMTSPSNFVWENVVGLQKIQFPWRWMAVASVIVSLAFVFAVSKFIETFQANQNSLILLIFLLFIPVFVYQFTQTIIPSITLNYKDFNRETSGLGEKKGCECWQPIWSNAEIFTKPEKVTANNRAVTINQWASEVREFGIEAGTSQNIRVATFYYPHWQAEVNGNAVAVEKDVDGSILIPVGREESRIKLNFREPKMLQFSLVISLLTWLSLIIASLLNYFKKT